MIQKIFLFILVLSLTLSQKAIGSDLCKSYFKKNQLSQFLSLNQIREAQNINNGFILPNSIERQNSYLSELLISLIQDIGSPDIQADVVNFQPDVDTFKNPISYQKAQLRVFRIESTRLRAQIVIPAGLEAYNTTTNKKVSIEPNQIAATGLLIHESQNRLVLKFYVSVNTEVTDKYFPEQMTQVLIPRKPRILSFEFLNGNLESVQIFEALEIPNNKPKNSMEAYKSIAKTFVALPWNFIFPHPFKTLIKLKK